MLDLTFLYGGRASGSIPHRYGAALSADADVPAGERHAVASNAATRRPVVVWNLTRACNLACQHCYAGARAEPEAGELDTAAGLRLLDDLAAFGIPALLLSGGEPLLRPDFFLLLEKASSLGLRVVLSTNGTLLTPESVRRLQRARCAYVGISLDGLPETHDRFRQQPGAFDRALAGVRGCREAGQKVGLRLTLTRSTLRDLPDLCALADREAIPRVCCYHLVPSGRGRELEALAGAQSRQALDFLLERAREWAARERPRELLTVDNFCDGPYLWLKLRAEGRNAEALQAQRLLRWNGGALNSAGVGLAAIGADGTVHPDQFWDSCRLGNVRERPFSEIWDERSNPVLADLRARRSRLSGRCATCRFFEMCGGGLRSRAALALGDPWASDPACYLTDAEIAPA